MAQTDGQVLTVVNGGASWANANSDGNGIYSGNGTSPADLEITVTDSIDFDDGTLFIDGSNDRIGIGTGIPSDKLTIYDPVDADLLIQVSPTSSTSSLSLQFGTNSQTTASKIESSIDWDVSNDILSLNNGGLGISIINGGDVGINTTSPTSPLRPPTFNILPIPYSTIALRNLTESSSCGSFKLNTSPTEITSKFNCVICPTFSLTDILLIISSILTDDWSWCLGWLQATKIVAVKRRYK